MEAKFSERDDRGRLFVDCTECERGIIGKDKGSCACGLKHMKGHTGGCFNGELLKTLEVKENL